MPITIKIGGIYENLIFYSGEIANQIGLFSPLFLLTKNNIMKRIIFICLFSVFWSSVGISEPKLIDNTTMIRIHLAGVYKRSINRLMDAQIYVESRGNPFAVSPFGDYGILQIRQIKLDDYYQKTGKRYTLQDCFNPEVSKEVYLYYANRIGTTPDKWETIARAWAGGLSKAKHDCTLDYWERVSKQLNK